MEQTEGERRIRVSLAILTGDDTILATKQRMAKLIDDINLMHDTTAHRKGQHVDLILQGYRQDAVKMVDTLSMLLTKILTH